MRLLNCAALCFFISTINAFNPLRIEEGETFKSSLASSVYLYCTSVSPLQESSKGGKYEFLVYALPSSINDTPLGRIDFAYDPSEKGVFMNSLRINDSKNKQEIEIAAMIVAFKICVNKLASASFDAFLTLLPDSAQDFLSTLNKMGFKSTEGAIFHDWSLMKLTIEDFLARYPKPALVTDK